MWDFRRSIYPKLRDKTGHVRRSVGPCGAVKRARPTVMMASTSTGAGVRELGAEMLGMANPGKDSGAGWAGGAGEGREERGDAGTSNYGGRAQ